MASTRFARSAPTKPWFPARLQIGNIRLGVPVRVTRKQPDPSTIYGSVFVYDGLYDVVRSPTSLRLCLLAVEPRLSASFSQRCASQHAVLLSSRQGLSQAN